MTDTRLNERWFSDRRILRLSDSHYRSFMTSLQWSVINRTDGVIEPEDLALIPKFDSSAPKAFVAAALWRPKTKGWLIADYAITQSSRNELESLEKIRARDRERKAKQRAAAKPAKPQATDECTPCPGDSPGDMSQDRYLDYTGRKEGRTGQATNGGSKHTSENSFSDPLGRLG